MGACICQARACAEAQKAPAPRLSGAILRNQRRPNEPPEGDDVSSTKWMFILFIATREILGSEGPGRRDFSRGAFPVHKRIGPDSVVLLGPHHPWCSTYQPRGPRARARRGSFPVDLLVPCHAVPVIAQRSVFESFLDGAWSISVGFASWPGSLGHPLEPQPHSFRRGATQFYGLQTLGAFLVLRQETNDERRCGNNTSTFARLIPKERTSRPRGPTNSWSPVNPRLVVLLPSCYPRILDRSHLTHEYNYACHPQVKTNFTGYTSLAIKTNKQQNCGDSAVPSAPLSFDMYRTLSCAHGLQRSFGALRLCGEVSRSPNPRAATPGGGYSSAASGVLLTKFRKVPSWRCRTTQAGPTELDGAQGSRVHVLR